MQGGGNFYDLNTADKYREFGAQIPDGEHVWLKIVIKPGNKSLPGFSSDDNGLFTGGDKSDFVYAAMEFNVTRPSQYAGSKLFENFGFAGGQVNDKGESKAVNITKMRIRGIVESAFGIHPDDTSPQAQQARRIPSVKALETLEFAARIGIEEGGKNEETGATYPNRNMISKIILPGDPEYAPMRNNQPVPPVPMGIRAARGGGNRNAGTGGGSGGGGQSALWQVEAAQHTPAPVPQPQPQPQYQQPPQPQQQPQPQYQQPPQPQPQPQGGSWAQPQPQGVPATPPAPPPQAPDPAAVWAGGQVPSNQTADAPGWLNG